MTINTNPLTGTVSLSHKVQTPNRFEMAEVFISVSGITPNATPDDIDEVLAANHLAYKQIANELRARIEVLRREGVINEFGHELEEE